MKLLNSINHCQSVYGIVPSVQSLFSRLTILIALVLLCLKFIQAQPNKIDSLKLVYATAQHDSVKVEAYRLLGMEYLYSWPDSTILFSTQALKLAQQLNLRKQQVRLLGQQASAYSQMGNFSIGLEKAFEAHKLALLEDDPLRLIRIVHTISIVYFYAGDYQNALAYILKAKKIAPSIGYANYGNNLDRASEEAGILGEIYFHLNQFDSAEYYIKQSIARMKRLNMHWSVPYLYMGKLDEREGKFSSALGLYRISMKESTAKVDFIKGYLAIATLYSKTQQIDSGIYYARLAHSISKSTSIYIHSYETCELLKQLFKTTNLDSAYKYQELMLSLKDNLYSLEKINEMNNVAAKEEERQRAIEDAKTKFKNQLNLYVSLGGTGALLIVAFFLYRNSRLKQKAKENIERAYNQLKSTQHQLIQSEKMASLGELTAGIAHEIQNPLNFVNNFSEVSNELIKEIQDIRRKTQEVKGKSEEDEILKDVADNLEKINHHGKRASDIVKSMLQHSRGSSGQKELTDINVLCDEYLRLAYHGLRAKDKSFNAKFETDFDASLPKINVVPQDIGRVILNLINNAFYAVSEKSKGERQKSDSSYEPAVSVTTKNLGDKIEINVKDNGNGIPDLMQEKIFQPFFTTKPTGKGTGLGLSLSYDIVKKHGGDLKVDSVEGKGSVFIIILNL